MGAIGYWQQTVTIASLIATAFLVSKLYFTGLAKVYKWFTYYLAFGILTALVLRAVGPGSNRYAQIWLCSKPVQWMLGLAVVLEMFSLVLSKYPGIATLLRWTVAGATILSLVISILCLSLEFQNPNEKFPLLRCAFAIQSTVTGTMAISLLVPLLFMARFPVVLCRNVVMHCLLFSGLMGSETAALIGRNVLGHEFNAMANLLMTCATVLCLLGWLMFLTQKGEVSAKTTGPKYSADTERQLLDQLRAFNEALTRTSQGARGAA